MICLIYSENINSFWLAGAVCSSDCVIVQLGLVREFNRSGLLCAHFRVNGVPRVLLRLTELVVFVRVLAVVHLDVRDCE